MLCAGYNTSPVFSEIPMIIAWFIADISLGVGALLASLVIGLEVFTLLRRDARLGRKLTTDTHFVTISTEKLEDFDTTKPVNGKNVSSNIR
jgi:hypothetical protein